MYNDDYYLMRYATKLGFVDDGSHNLVCEIADGRIKVELQNIGGLRVLVKNADDAYVPVMFRMVGQGTWDYEGPWVDLFQKWYAEAIAKAKEIEIRDREEIERQHALEYERLRRAWEQNSVSLRDAWVDQSEPLELTTTTPITVNPKTPEEVLIDGQNRMRALGPDGSWNTTPWWMRLIGYPPKRRFTSKGWQYKE